MRMVSEQKYHRKPQVMLMRWPHRTQTAAPDFSEFKDFSFVTNARPQMSSQKNPVDVTQASDAKVDTTQLSPPPITIRAATNKGDVASFAAFSREYADWLLTSLNLDVSFQSFQQEMDSLPGDYGPPSGSILLASVPCADGGRQDIGAIAIRPFDASHVLPTATPETQFSFKTCELKRLYVPPKWQKCGAGRLLTEAAISTARQMGYKRVVLDCVKQLSAANRMYERLEFKPCANYNRYQYPVPDVVFWELTM